MDPGAPGQGGAAGGYPGRVQEAPHPRGSRHGGQWAPTGASPAPRSCTPSLSPWRSRLVILVEDKYLNIQYQEPDKLNFLLDIRHIE